MLSVAILFAPWAAESSIAAASSPDCSVANTFAWAAFEGSGTAGTTFYVLEFSNIGPTTCTLNGIAKVWAVNRTGVQLGKPATRQGPSSAVTLAPNGTAHAILGVTDTGALCPGQAVQATGLRVIPPGQTLSTPLGEKDEIELFPVEVCANRSSMHVEPVRAGTGIPLHTTS
jgi:hypothetical protein